MAVIDLHSHLVPGVDDGARSVEEATGILTKMDKAYGPDSMVVLTPHYATFMPGRVLEARQKRACDFVESIRRTPELNLELELVCSGELLVSGFKLNNLEAARYPGTGWVLVEFAFGVTWLETLAQIKRILKQGYQPLIAHPERYYWCRRRGDRLGKLSELGCGSLVSARSFRHQKYAPVARQLLRRGLAHAISSDAHSRSDYILDSRLRAVVDQSAGASWDFLTCEMPGIIMDDGVLPELPLKRKTIL